jgi:hypothetical protein
MKSDLLDVMTYSSQSGESCLLVECSSSKCDINRGERLIRNSLAKYLSAQIDEAATLDMLPDSRIRGTMD